MPCLRIGSGTLYCPTPSCIVQSPFSFCACCHSIVGLVLCLCDRVVSLWNGGGGLVVLCCGLWNGGVCVVCVWCVCGLVVCLPLLSVFLFLLRVGVRGSARAALRARTLSPNTIASPLLFALFFSALLFSSLLPAFLHHPPFLLLEWRCVIHHVLECCVGMTAMGSLSRSSPFFW